MLIQREFIPSILKPTRITHRSSTLIDNIYVKSNPINQSLSYVIEDGRSVHYACFVSYIVKRDKLRDTPVTLNRRKLTDDVLLKIQQDLLFHDWGIINDMSVNNGYNYLSNVLSNTMNKFAPLKTVKICIDEKFREPWLNVKIMKYNHKCRHLCNKARQSGLESDHNRYKQYRNTLNRIKLHEKKSSLQ